jgi:hypothetical protein
MPCLHVFRLLSRFLKLCGGNYAKGGGRGAKDGFGTWPSITCAVVPSHLGQQGCLSDLPYNSNSTSTAESQGRSVMRQTLPLAYLPLPSSSPPATPNPFSRFPLNRKLKPIYPSEFKRYERRRYLYAATNGSSQVYSLSECRKAKPSEFKIKPKTKSFAQSVIC